MAWCKGLGEWKGVGLSQSSCDLFPFPPAPRGKRGWKSFHGILKGMILYLQKVRGQPKGWGLSWLWGMWPGWARLGLWPGQDGHPAGGVPAWEGRIGGRA